MPLRASISKKIPTRPSSSYDNSLSCLLSSSQRAWVYLRHRTNLSPTCSSACRSTPRSWSVLTSPFRRGLAFPISRTSLDDAQSADDNG